MTPEEIRKGLLEIGYLPIGTTQMIDEILRFLSSKVVPEEREHRPKYERFNNVQEGCITLTYPSQTCDCGADDYNECRAEMLRRLGEGK